jgi:hypothetical protein
MSLIELLITAKNLYVLCVQRSTISILTFIQKLNIKDQEILNINKTLIKRLFVRNVYHFPDEKRYGFERKE